MLAKAGTEYDVLNRPYLQKRYLWDTDSGASVELSQKTIFDPASNVVKVLDVRGQEALSLEYDGAERLKSQTDKMGNKVVFEYDAGSNVTSTTATEISSDESSVTVLSSAIYDALDRPGQSEGWQRQ